LHLTKFRLTSRAPILLPEFYAHLRRQFLLSPRNFYSRHKSSISVMIRTIVQRSLPHIVPLPRPIICRCSALCLLPRLSFHSSSSSLNGEINPPRSTRTAGPERAELMRQKRARDQTREQQAQMTPDTTFKNDQEFRQRIHMTYVWLENGLSDMLSSNPSMSIEHRDEDGLEVALGDAGSFIFSPDVESRRLSMFSPVTATVYRYHWDANNERWIADSDDHIFQEAFVRDIISTKLTGYPNL